MRKRIESTCYPSIKRSGLFEEFVTVFRTEFFFHESLSLGVSGNSKMVSITHLALGKRGRIQTFLGFIL